MEEIELREYWTIIRKRLMMVIAIPILAVIVSGLISFFVLKPQYQASTTLLVNQKLSSNAGLAYQDVMANQALVGTYTDIIKSATVETAVAEALNLPYTVTQLNKMIQVSSPNQSQVIQVTVTAPSEPLAANIANTLGTKFQQKAQILMDVQNVQIVDRAPVLQQASPVKPNKKLNIAIAFILGLMVSVGLAFLLEYLDTRLRTEQDIQRYLKLPILGVIAEYENES